MTKTIILLKGNFKATEKNLVIFNNEYNLIISLDYNSHKVKS